MGLASHCSCEIASANKAIGLGPASASLSPLNRNLCFFGGPTIANKICNFRPLGVARVITRSFYGADIKTPLIGKNIEFHTRAGRCNPRRYIGAQSEWALDCRS